MGECHGCFSWPVLGRCCFRHLPRPHPLHLGQLRQLGLHLDDIWEQGDVQKGAVLGECVQQAWLSNLQYDIGRHSPTRTETNLRQEAHLRCKAQKGGKPKGFFPWLLAWPTLLSLAQVTPQQLCPLRCHDKLISPKTMIRVRDRTSMTFGSVVGVSVDLSSVCLAHPGS